MERPALGMEGAALLTRPPSEPYFSQIRDQKRSSVEVEPAGANLLNTVCLRLKKTVC